MASAIAMRSHEKYWPNYLLIHKTNKSMSGFTEFFASFPISSGFSWHCVVSSRILHCLSGKHVWVSSSHTTASHNPLSRWPHWYQKPNLYPYYHKDFLVLQKHLTHLFPMNPFSTPWKHQKTVRFSDVFWGYGKGALGTDGLIAS